MLGGSRTTYTQCALQLPRSNTSCSSTVNNAFGQHLHRYVYGAWMQHSYAALLILGISMWKAFFFFFFSCGDVKCGMPWLTEWLLAESTGSDMVWILPLFDTVNKCCWMLMLCPRSWNIPPFSNLVNYFWRHAAFQVSSRFACRQM